MKYITHGLHLTEKVVRSICPGLTAPDIHN
jgi:hypothetical protein